MPQYEMALMSVAAYRQVLRNMRNTSGAAPTEESAAALLQVSCTRAHSQWLPSQSKASPRLPRRDTNLYALRRLEWVSRAGIGSWAGPSHTPHEHFTGCGAG